MTLKEYLDRFGVSQADFARKAGVDRSQVHHWLKGDHVPTLRTVLVIAKVTKNEVTANDWGER